MNADTSTWATQSRAALFVDHLAGNPALRQFTPLQREEQIIQFLQKNAATLAPTLSSGAYFPGMRWEQIFSLLMDDITKKTNQELLPAIRGLVTEKVDFDFLHGLGMTSIDRVREDFITVLEKIVERPAARGHFSSAFTAVYYDLFPRYVMAAYERKTYVYFEINKVQRLRLEHDQVSELIKVVLLLRPSITLFSSGETLSVSGGSIQPQYAERVTKALRDMIPILPEAVVKGAVNSNMSFLDNRFIEATSRIAAIFAARSRNYHPITRLDRGADTPDKSWMSIARRNSRHYGFDAKMLDEFYVVSSEKGW